MRTPVPKTNKRCLLAIPEINTIMTALKRSIYKPMGMANTAEAPGSYARSAMGPSVATTYSVIMAPQNAAPSGQAAIFARVWRVISPPAPTIRAAITYYLICRFGQYVRVLVVRLRDANNLACGLCRFNLAFPGFHAIQGVYEMLAIGH